MRRGGSSFTQRSGFNDINIPKKDQYIRITPAGWQPLQ